VTSDLPLGKLEREFQDLSKAAHQDFRSEGWVGAIHEQRSIDTRYRGQGYELAVPYSRKLIAGFHRAHAQRYGYSHPEREVELVTLRLRATLKSPQSRVASHRQQANPGISSKLEKARVLFYTRPQPATVYERDQLTPGRKYAGPAIIPEYSATTVVPPRTRFFIDRAGNLQIAVSKQIER
jgi:N-methylhydantoinase A